MRLTIVIPVFRVEDTLDRCLESVVGQTFTDMEIILVDDGSPDRSGSMCDEWARRDQRVRVLHKANGGLSSARNAGLDMARGELVTFVDSDDFVGRDTYGQVVPLALEADIVEFSFCWHYGSIGQETILLADRQHDDMEAYWLQGRAYTHTYACNKIFRRELFSGVRFPEGRVFEDVATLPHLLQKARKVITTHKGCYYYCMNRGGITATAKGDELNMLLESHLDAMTHWQDDAYYMHVLNTQMDVCEQLGCPPVLPMRHVSPLAQGLSGRQRIKAVLLNIIGISRLCHFNKTIHLLTGRRS